MLEQFVFYFFAVILLLSASMVVVARNPVHAALFLILSFFSSATIWLLLHAEFLAITLVLVYVGAVMVLFLFVVMMLDINRATFRDGFVRYLLTGVIVAFLMAVAMGLVVGSDYFSTEYFMFIRNTGGDYSNTQELGRTLYTQYLYQFEVAGVILLVSLVAAISLGMKKQKNTKRRDAIDQVFVKKQDRLRVVQMQAEKKNHD